jgi:bisphosphoglycerate-dependent phosphoglycerate mutase
MEKYARSQSHLTDLMEAWNQEFGEEELKTWSRSYDFRIYNYNASVVKIYSATISMARF